jgi:hypothetical protein
MKRALITVGAVVVLVGGVSTAEASIAKGKFAGKTAAKDPIGFKVDKSGRVYSFYFQGVTLRCTDGDQFDTPSKENPDPEDGSTEVRTRTSDRFPVDSKNRWGLTGGTKEAGNGYTVAGRFLSQDKSQGTFSIFANFTDGGPGNVDPPDPDGEIRCKSGKLKFSAKRQ